MIREERDFLEHILQERLQSEEEQLHDIVNWEFLYQKEVLHQKLLN